MEITYDAVWYTDKGTTRITHEILTDEDLTEAVERKNIRETLDP